MTSAYQYSAMPALISGYYPGFLKKELALPIIGGVMLGTLVVVAGIVAVVVIAKKKNMMNFGSGVEHDYLFSNKNRGHTLMMTVEGGKKEAKRELADVVKDPDEWYGPEKQ